MTARFIPSDYPGGRILLRSGTMDVGAVFPPAGVAQHHVPWVWRLWINGTTVSSYGGAKTEQAAKNALLAEWRDFLTRAGLVEQSGGAE